MTNRQFKILSTIFCVLGLVTILLTILTYGLADQTNDATRQYSIYNDVKAITCVEELLPYFQENGIEYLVESNEISLVDFSEITFAITDNKYCQINQSDLMNGFEKLDARDYGTVKVEGESVDGKIREKISYKFGSYEVVKTESTYTYKNSLYTYKLILLFILAFSTASLFILYYLRNKENKQKKVNLDN